MSGRFYHINRENSTKEIVLLLLPITKTKNLHSSLSHHVPVYNKNVTYTVLITKPTYIIEFLSQIFNHFQAHASTI